MQQPRLPLYLIDDDTAVCRSLAVLLEAEGFRARCFASAVTFLSEMTSAPAGIIVSDVRMPEMDGIQLLTALRHHGRTDPVIMVTGDGDVPTAVQALKLGAIDFIEKPYEVETMIAAVEEARHHLAGAHATDHTVRLSRLSVREREVFSALLDGATNKHVARELGISHRTVEIYRAKVMQKLEVRTLSQLVRLGVEAGLGSPAVHEFSREPF